jgi:hypothetical protein
MVLARNCSTAFAALSNTQRPFDDPNERATIPKAAKYHALALAITLLLAYRTLDGRPWKLSPLMYASAVEFVSQIRRIGTPHFLSTWSGISVLEWAFHAVA